MPITIKKTTKNITTTASNKAVATMENIPEKGMVAHLTIPIDVGKLRYKGGKSAYFTYGIWIEGQRGCRIQGNVFISTKRLSAKTLEQATNNYKNKDESVEDKEEEEEELF